MPRKAKANHARRLRVRQVEREGLAVQRLESLTQARRRFIEVLVEQVYWMRAAAPQCTSRFAGPMREVMRLPFGIVAYEQQGTVVLYCRDSIGLARLGNWLRYNRSFYVGKMSDLEKLAHILKGNEP